VKLGNRFTRQGVLRVKWEDYEEFGSGREVVLSAQNRIASGGVAGRLSDYVRVASSIKCVLPARRLQRCASLTGDVRLNEILATLLSDAAQVFDSMPLHGLCRPPECKFAASLLFWNGPAGRRGYAPAARSGNKWSRQSSEALDFDDHFDGGWRLQS